MINAILNGCNGAMGQTITRLTATDEQIQIVSGIDKQPDLWENTYPVFSSYSECNIEADVIIDFSRPEALPEIVEHGKKTGTALVLATTGYSHYDYGLVEEAANTIPVFISSNMSLGVNLLVDICKKAAEVLGGTFDIEIVEKHHNRKVDAPSGTAIILAKAINEVFNNYKDFSYGRYGKSAKRSNEEIGIHAIRGGTIVGEHSVIFAGKDEVVELNHKAYSRDIFGLGAIKAAKFITTKEKGLYQMKDMLL